MTTKVYYDKGVCASDLYLSTNVEENYECVQSSGAFLESQTCISAAPQGTVGYVYQQYYNEIGCSGNRSASEGFYGDYCYYSQSTATYYKYYFTQSDCSDLVQRFYSDSACLNHTSESAVSSYGECNDITGGFPAASSYKGFCSVGDTIPVQMAGYLMSEYVQEGCSTAIHYEIYSTNLCVDLSLSGYNYSEYATCTDSLIQTKVYNSSATCSIETSISYESTYTCEYGSDDDQVVNPSSTISRRLGFLNAGMYLASENVKSGSLSDPYKSVTCVDSPPSGTDGYVFSQFYGKLYFIFADIYLK